MLENVTTFFKKMGKKEQLDKSSKDEAKERLHLVLMQDRANVSADFLEMMKQEIVDVIKKYIDVDENEMNVKLENRLNDDGTSGAPSLYANIPIMAINEEKKKESNELAKAKKLEESEEESKDKKTVKKKTKSSTKKTSTTKTASAKATKTTKKASSKEETENDDAKKTKTTKKSTKKENDDESINDEENVAKPKKTSKRTASTKK